MASSTCPICGRSFDPGSTRAMPFCSVRCQQIDLGRWLGEEYGLPVEPEGEETGEDAYDDPGDGDNGHH